MSLAYGIIAVISLIMVGICVAVDKKQLLVVNEAGEFVAEGQIVLYVGVSQPDARSEALTGHACVKLAL